MGGGERANRARKNVGRGKRKCVCVCGIVSLLGSEFPERRAGKGTPTRPSPAWPHLSEFVGVPSRPAVRTRGYAFRQT